MMKKFLMVTVCTLAIAAGAFDFAGSDPLLYSGPERGQTMVAEPGALKLGWNTNPFRYAEIAFRKHLPVSEFQRLHVEVVVRSSGAEAVTMINPRLADAKGETFQWNLPVAVREAGTHRFELTMTPGNFNAAWGKDGDKKIDWPLRFSGVSVSFPANAAAGSLELVSMEPRVLGDDEYAIREKWFGFDDRELWTTTFDGGSGARVESGEGVGVRGTGAMGVRLHERKMPLLTRPFPDGALLRAELRSGRAAVRMLMIAPDGKRYHTKPVELRPGLGEYPLRFEADRPALTGKIGYLEIQFPDGAPGEVTLHSLEAELRKTLPEAVSVEIDTGDPLHILRPEDVEKLALALRNHAPVSADVEVEARFTDYYGTRFVRNWNLTLPAGESRRLPVEAGKPPLGIWWCDITLRTKNQAPAKRRMAFCVMEPAGPTEGRADGFLFGIQAHSVRWSKFEGELEARALALCGAKVWRTSPEWIRVQPERGEWRFDHFDGLVKLYASLGVEPEAILSYTPPWAASPEAVRNGTWSRTMPELEAWREYVKTLAHRYRGAIRFWEVWNEPDIETFSLFSAADYVKLLQIAHEECKAADPEIQVLTGGFATVGAHPSMKKGFQEEVLRSGRGFYDIHAFHEHQMFPRFSERIDEIFLPMRARAGADAPWYANETAVASMDGDEALQAKSLFKKLLFAWARGAVGYNWYDLRNDGFDPKYGEHNFGLLTNDFYPKAAYPVYNTLTTVFRDKKFASPLPVRDGMWAFRFENGRELAIPFWSEDAASRMVLIQTDAVSAETVDMMGNRAPLALVDGMAPVLFSPEPSILLLRGASRAEAAGILIDGNAFLAVTPGRQGKFAFEVANPFGSARRFQLALNVPAGIAAGETRREITLEAGKSERVSFPIQVAADFGGRAAAEIRYTVAPDGFEGTVRFPVRSALLVEGCDFDRPADFTLDRRDQVVSVCEGDPGKAHLIWRDAADLSAKIHLGMENDAIRLRVEVRDDVHVQPFHGAEVWKGDNIQMVLDSAARKGNWEIGLTHGSAGAQLHVWQAPIGIDSATAAAGLRLETRREGDRTVYDATLPLKTLGYDAAMIREGIRFNLLVNDNDGDLREGWIQVAPGIAFHKDSSRSPLVIFK